MLDSRALIIWHRKLKPENCSVHQCAIKMNVVQRTQQTFIFKRTNSIISWMEYISTNNNLSFKLNMELHLPVCMHQKEISAQMYSCDSSNRDAELFEHKL